MKKRAAILDDYQKVASGLAAWAKLKDRVEFVFFNDHLVDERDISDRLRHGADEPRANPFFKISARKTSSP